MTQPQDRTTVYTIYKDNEGFGYVKNTSWDTQCTNKDRKDLIKFFERIVWEEEEHLKNGVS